MPMKVIFKNVQSRGGKGDLINFTMTFIISAGEVLITMIALFQSVDFCGKVCLSKIAHFFVFLEHCDMDEAMHF